MFLILSPAFIRMRYMARRVRQSNICFLKKSWFPNIFAKNSPAKKFRPLKISASVNYNITIAAKQSAKKSCKCVCRKRASKLKNAVGYGECRICFKNMQNFRLFLTKPDRKKIDKTFHCRPVNWMVFLWLVQKHLHFQAYCTDKTQKIPLPFKKSQKWNFFGY